MTTGPSPESGMTRRRLLAAAALGSASLLVSACASPRPQVPPPPSLPPALPPGLPSQPRFGEDSLLLGYREMYGRKEDDGHVIPAVPIEQVDPRYYRQMVPDPTGEAPGTIVVDTSNHFLYLVQSFGQALRYGVGLGRAGFAWSGRAEVEWKQPWPRWFPPDEMIDRQPELERYRVGEYDPVARRWLGGQEPGITNPLGARALYIYQDGKDTLYRLHGSPEWNSIGRSVSSGCVRLMNQDVIDLYDRVPEKTPIVVTSGLRVT